MVQKIQFYEIEEELYKFNQNLEKYQNKYIRL